MVGIAERAPWQSSGAMNVKFWWVDIIQGTDARNQNSAVHFCKIHSHAWAVSFSLLRCFRWNKKRSCCGSMVIGCNHHRRNRRQSSSSNRGFHSTAELAEEWRGGAHTFAVVRIERTQQENKFPPLGFIRYNIASHPSCRQQARASSSLTGSVVLLNGEFRFSKRRPHRSKTTYLEFTTGPAPLASACGRHTLGKFLPLAACILKESQYFCH